MIYLNLGQGVRQGVTLYKDLHDNKPPLLYWTAAVAGNLFWFKAILAAWSLATIILFYRLAVKLFEKNPKAQKISVLIFAISTTLPILEGSTVNSELFMIGFTVWAFIILLGEGLTPRKIFAAGFLLGIGALFKIPAAFDAPIIVAYWIIVKGVGKWREVFRDALILFAGFASPILLTVIYYFFNGAHWDYIKAGFLQNIGYLSSFRPGDIRKPFLERNAPLLIRASIVAAGIFVVYIFRKRLSKNFILLTVWLLFALFAIALSERPYPHYFIQAIAPISFLLAKLFAEKSFEQSLVVIPLTVAFFVPVFYKFYLYPTSTYYLRFLNFSTGGITRDEYFNSFDSNTVRNYKIADFLAQATTSKDRVFVWDPTSPTIYALSRRLPPIKYVVPYHVIDYSSMESVAEDIIKSPPKFIVLTPDNPYPEISKLLTKSYLLINQIEGADIYLRLSK